MRLDNGEGDHTSLCFFSGVFIMRRDPERDGVFGVDSVPVSGSLEGVFCLRFFGDATTNLGGFDARPELVLRTFELVLSLTRGVLV
jgi:hypothetical protein